MPHDPAMRPVSMIRAGLFLYDHLARRELLPGSRVVELSRHAAGAPLKKHFTKGFVYSDVWVDDARLVVLNAIDASERGASVLTRTACVDARRGAEGWRVRLQSAGGVSTRLTARMLVNAAGPWAAQFLGEHAHLGRPRVLRLVKGSHVIVPRLFEHDHAYIFQIPDKRIIFAIPYEGEFTLIGTTDVEGLGVPAAVCITANEIDYLCAQASRYFERRVTPSDVVRTYSGLRPLLDDESGDPSEVTRDYSLELDSAGGAALLNVWGGKLTTYRKLAEEAAGLLGARLALRRDAWTGGVPLPGGDLSAWIGSAERPDTAFARFEQAVAQRHRQLPAALRRRLARQYGARIETVLGSSSLGTEVAPGLFEAELGYLHDHEWARNADDVLWRRTKLGLHLGEAQRAAVATWCKGHWSDHVAPTPSSWG
jgi:glycerol-3-phosphate dehydrogenase